MLINKEQINYITIHNFELDGDYIWKDAYYRKSTFWRKQIKYNEGVYTKKYFSDGLELVDDWEDIFVIKDGLVRRKPRIKIHFSNKHVEIKRFESIGERDTYINTHFNDNKYLKIHE